MRIRLEFRNEYSMADSPKTIYPWNIDLDFLKKKQIEIKGISKEEAMKEIYNRLNGRGREKMYVRNESIYGKGGMDVFLSLDVIERVITFEK